VVSLLAVTTSLVGVILGFVNEFYDAIGALPSQSYGPKDDNKWQVALLTLVPSAFFSILLGYYVPDMDRCQVMECLWGQHAVSHTAGVDGLAESIWR
jgi:hypothetical protein